MNNKKTNKKIVFSVKDTFITIYMLVLATLFCLILEMIYKEGTYVSMVFLLAVFIISRMTEGYFYGIVGAITSVFFVNYVFTYPYMQLNFILAGYPLTFITMMIVAGVTSTMTSQLKESEQIKAEAKQEKMRGNLLRSVSHDLRTPLTAIIGSAEAAADSSVDEAKRLELIEGISKDAGWLLRMVENMLSITRLENAGANIKMQAELAEEIVSSAVLKFKKWHPGRELKVESPDELIMVSADPVLIEQVIINFLDNAVRHSGDTEEIILRVEMMNKEAAFQVLDRGIGISKETEKTLFTHGSKMSGEEGDSHRGMGIGLSVCRTIIKAHEGRVFAGNRTGGGAIFMFTLPMIEVDYEQ